MNKKLLKNKNFLLVIVGNFVSLMGSNIQQFVLALYVLALTGSATLFATMIAIAILPRILLSPIAGVFGDWFDKKKSIVILDLLNAIILAGFAFYLFRNQSLSIGLIYLMVILLEITEVFFHSSISVVLPSVVEKEEYLEANSLRTIVVSIGQLMAPLIGALIYGLYGLLVAIIINAISFFLSAISEMFIKVPKSKSESNEKTFAGFKRDFVSGLRLVKDSKPIKLIMSMVVVVNFSMAPFFSVGMIFLVKEVLLRSDFQLGIMQTMISSSMILTPLLLTKKLKEWKISSVITNTFVMMGVFIIAIALSTHPILFNLQNGLISYIYTMFICFLIGILVTAVNIVINTFFQKIVPLEYMGRTSTVLGVFSTIAIPVGQMLFGYLYDIMNPGYVFIINGSIVLLVIMIFFNQLHHIDDKNAEEIQKAIMEREVMLSEV